jgi:hypothetical protein
MNLITSCAECNAGKGARALADSSILAKQRAQLEELNERREQMAMMLRWRENLAKLDREKADAVALVIAEKMGRTVTDRGMEDIAHWLIKYGLAVVLESTDEALGQYLIQAEEGGYTEESCNKVFSYIPRICSVKSREGDDPNRRQLLYIRGILRNRLSYVDERLAINAMRNALSAGATLDELTDLARDVRNWTQWTNAVHEFIETGEW